MIVLRPSLALVVGTVLATGLVVLDLGGVVRSVAALGLLLVAPGFALTLVMGPMSPEARALVTVAGSASITTLLSLAMSAVGLWSAELASLVVAVGVLVLCHVDLRRSTATPGSSAESAVPPDPSPAPAPPGESSAVAGTDHSRRTDP